MISGTCSVCGRAIRGKSYILSVDNIVMMACQQCYDGSWQQHSKHGKDSRAMKKYKENHGER